MPKPKRQAPNWKDVLNELRTTISDESVQRWFSATRLQGIRNGTATICVPNNIYQLWIESNYREALVSALQALDPTIRKITVRVDEPAAGERNVRRQKVFVSYSHRDHAILERLLIHLRPLDRDLAIETWTDRKISYGSDWRH